MNINNENERDLVVIQITDLHIFTNGNQEFDGVNPALSLESVIQQIKLDFPDFDLMIATGDLVQEPDQKAYENVLELLSPIKQPIYYLPGNHDSPEMMDDIFGQSIKHQINFDHWAFFTLNTFNPLDRNGILTNKELSELDDGLKNTKDLNVLICLHHQPVLIGSDWMDRMMLENADEFFSVVDKYAHVKSIVWGHNHQEFSQIRNDVQLLGTPSTCVQYKPGSKNFALDETEQPGYRWLKLAKNGSIETGVVRLKQNDQIKK